MNKKRYDIFINYRRDPGRDFARTLQQAFKSRGYSVFFDYDSLQDGKFNEEIFSAIESCDVFVVSYSQGSLDRCKNDNDWVRIEIEHALKLRKKIVPVAPSEVFANLAFPKDLPPSLSVLRTIETTEIHTGKYFDDSIERCIHERFKRRSKAFMAIVFAAIAIVCLVVLTAIFRIYRQGETHDPQETRQPAIEPDPLEALREGIRSGEIHVMTKEEANKQVRGILKTVHGDLEHLKQVTSEIGEPAKDTE